MTLFKAPPRYLINPAANRKPVWTPDICQVVLGHKNPSYLNSVWLGVCWNMAIVPYRVTRELLWSVFNFRFQIALLSLIVLPVSVFWLAVKGVLGQVSAHSIPLHLTEQSMILNPTQSKDAMSLGFTDILIDLDALPAEMFS